MSILYLSPSLPPSLCDSIQVRNLTVQGLQINNSDVILNGALLVQAPSNFTSPIIATSVIAPSISTTMVTYSNTTITANTIITAAQLITKNIYWVYNPSGATTITITLPLPDTSFAYTPFTFVNTTLVSNSIVSFAVAGGGQIYFGTASTPNQTFSIINGLYDVGSATLMCISINAGPLAWTVISTNGI